ncbi:hypothetical protein ES703_112447 [subsurface metagenome]
MMVSGGWGWIGMRVPIFNRSAWNYIMMPPGVWFHRGMLIIAIVLPSAWRRCGRSRSGVSSRRAMTDTVAI